MSELIVKKISHYRIVEQIGQGGMGVVYKAEDTKLERTIALKFLSRSLIGGKEENERFKREAKAAAALNHPNIAHVYAVDEVDGQAFIAMEFIEGQELREIVGANNGSPLPLDKAIDYATQISAGLQAAHEKGIVHRDIKSANIMVTEKGAVKIMDFGLAKLSGRTKMTMQGTTLGTAAYMSPEQAQGAEVDHRSDIWSLGVVLYEMLSGQMPFKGDYEQAVIYSILHEEPEPLTALRSGLPIALDGIIAKALAKDPDTRYQHVDELPADLKAIDLLSLHMSRTSMSTAAPTALKPMQTMNQAIPWKKITPMLAFAAIVAGLAVWLSIRTEPPVSEAVTRFAIQVPASFVADPSLSPDGRRLAYEVSGNLYLHRMEELEDVLLRGSEGSQRPFFSPDGRWIGFYSNGMLKKMLVEGEGRPLNVVEVEEETSGTWGPDDKIIFGASIGLFQIPSAGGRPQQLTTPDTLMGEIGHYEPQMLPDGKSLLFNIKHTKGLGEARVAVLNLENGEIKTVVKGGTEARYTSSGHLIYARGEESQFVAAAFDVRSLKIKGSPVPIPELEGILPHGAAISMNGSLVYIPQKGETVSEQALLWVDRRGNETLLTKQRMAIRAPRLSPNGKQVAFDTWDGSEGNIWLYDIERGRTNRFTFERPRNAYPVWTPDGKWLLFSSGMHRVPILPFRKPVDGSGRAEQLGTERYNSWTRSLSPEARFLSFHTNYDNMDIRVLDLESRTSSPFLTTSASEGLPMFSPDGRWIAYVSDETGRMEVYVQPFPATGAKYLVSVDGGMLPVWGKDKHELFYLQGSSMMSVIYQANTSVFEVSEVQPLFTLPGGEIFWGASFYDYDDKNDRFLIVRHDANAGTHKIVIVFNWFSELKRLVPTGS